MAGTQFWTTVRALAAELRHTHRLPDNNLRKLLHLIISMRPSLEDLREIAAIQILHAQHYSHTGNDLSYARVRSGLIEYLITEETVTTTDEIAQWLGWICRIMPTAHRSSVNETRISLPEIRSSPRPKPIKAMPPPPQLSNEPSKEADDFFRKMQERQSGEGKKRL
jgi:hypothetical protein